MLRVLVYVCVYIYVYQLFISPISQLNFWWKFGEDDLSSIVEIISTKIHEKTQPSTPSNEGVHCLVKSMPFKEMLCSHGESFGQVVLYRLIFNSRLPSLH